MDLRIPLYLQLKNTLLNRIDTVSYTHLDVYKRQLYDHYTSLPS